MEVQENVIKKGSYLTQNEKNNINLNNNKNYSNDNILNDRYYNLIIEQAKEFENFGKRMSLNLQNFRKELVIQQNDIINDEPFDIEKVYKNCKEKIDSQVQLIDSLKNRIEDLENDSFIKTQDIKELQNDFSYLIEDFEDFETTVPAVVPISISATLDNKKNVSLIPELNFQLVNDNQQYSEDYYDEESSTSYQKYDEDNSGEDSSDEESSTSYQKHDEDSCDEESSTSYQKHDEDNYEESSITYRKDDENNYDEKSSTTYRKYDEDYNDEESSTTDQKYDENNYDEESSTYRKYDENYNDEESSTTDQKYDENNYDEESSTSYQKHDEDNYDEESSVTYRKYDEDYNEEESSTTDQKYDENNYDEESSTSYQKHDEDNYDEESSVTYRKYDESNYDEESSITYRKYDENNYDEESSTTYRKYDEDYNDEESSTTDQKYDENNYDEESSTSYQKYENVPYQQYIETDPGITYFDFIKFERDYTSALEQQKNEQQKPSTSSANRQQKPSTSSANRQQMTSTSLTNRQQKPSTSAVNKPFTYSQSYISNPNVPVHKEILMIIHAKVQEITNEKSNGKRRLDRKLNNHTFRPLCDFGMKNLLEYEKSYLFKSLSKRTRERIKATIIAELKDECINKNKKLTQPINIYAEKNIIPRLPSGINSYTDYQKHYRYNNFSDKTKRRIQKIISLEKVNH
ncbi:uncharacterized protein OCT59_015373 [Rhizophagus irregularis]|uniref:uncharacterized protein n=1 Tax=Rhizophagus irregularis TaxID=588596 RepID=UPI001D756C8F|nr:hypothetical protein OCT59_015373 [Rhizophagus irregularis]CAG8456054.1 8424_t:CDS:1 [Rhizophagus irregularis]